MEKRIPYHLKGKGVDRGYSPPPRRRIQAPELDTSALIEANSLTLMGRLTNPAAQRLWSLFPFLSNRWNLKGKTTGSDLGRGCFQFCFEYEEDMQKVLDNRPFHYDQWMVILQKWEPIISESFPSKIPFWIELQGLPKHYWQPAMLKTIGEDLGEIMEMDITNQSAKLKVLLDGLQPLIKETMVDFSDGSEALVSLEYKNLKNHCSHCQRLSHEKKNCPGLKREEENPSKPVTPAQQTTSKEPARNYYTPTNNFAAPSANGSLSANIEVSKSASSRQGRNPDTWRSKQPPRSLRNDRISGDYRSQDLENHRSYNSRNERSLYHRDKRYHSSPSSFYERDRNESRRVGARFSSSQGNPNLQWREKATSRLSPRRESSEISRTRRPPLERTFTSAEVTPPPPPPPIPTNEELMGELRDVTLQYVSCADPSESAARKRRVIQGEERGLMAATTSLILEAAINSNNAFMASAEGPNPSSIPALSDSQDLPLHPADLPLILEGPVKKKRGRPPLNKSAFKNATSLLGAKSSKRNKSLIQSSPKRKNTPERGINPQQAKATSSKTPKAKQRLTLQVGDINPSSSTATPKVNLIPARAKNKVDFHNPHPQLP